MSVRTSLTLPVIAWSLCIGMRAILRWCARIHGSGKATLFFIDRCMFTEKWLVDPMSDGKQ